MAGPKPTTPKPATVRVLHRAVDSDDDSSTPRGSGSSPQQSVQELKAQADSLKQRLEQARASAATEKKKLADELRLERAGRERAEELLVRQAKELEACAAAKARLEEAFSRSMSELRYTRAEHAQSKQTIQQLLSELMLLRDAISRSQQHSSSSYHSAAGGGSRGASSGRALTDGGGGGGGSPTAAAAAAGGSGGGGGGGVMRKDMSKGQLLMELQAMRVKILEEESRRKEAEAEKELAQESQEMISRQTAKLLDDRAALMSDLTSKDDAVRDLQSNMDHLQHQLHIALTDRELLLQQLRTLAGDGAAPELAALTAAMSPSGYSQDLDELEAFAHGEIGAEELHGSLRGVCSPRSRGESVSPAAAGGGGVRQVLGFGAEQQQQPSSPPPASAAAGGEGSSSSHS